MAAAAVVRVVQGSAFAAVVSGFLCAAAGAQAPARDEATAAVETDAAGDASSDALSWPLVHRRYSGRDGSSGGLFVSDPDSGEAGSFRLQLVLDGAPRDDFMRDGTEVSQSRQALSVSWTPLAWLETYGSLHNRGTASAAPGVPSQHALGEWALGLKAFTEVWPLVRAGGGVRVALRDDASGDAIDLGATSAEITGAVSIDLREARRPTPFVARLALLYVFDNSAVAVEGVELARYVGLDDPLPVDEEDAHLLTRFERYALGVSRVDRFEVGLGFEAPLEVIERTYVHPLLEARLAVPVNRQGYGCPIFTDLVDPGTPASDRDSCVAVEGLAAWPLRLTVGARVAPPVEGLSFLLALDWGVTATDRFVHELAPSAPVVILAGLGFDFDAEPAPPPAVVEVPAPVPPRGRVRGTLVDEATGHAVAGASVRVIGAALGMLASDDEGRFVSYLLPPGEVELEIAHSTYVTARCKASVPEAGGDIEARCGVAARRDLARLEGRAVDAFGTPVAGAVVSLAGATGEAALGEVTTGMDGRFVLRELEPGRFAVRVETAVHLVRAWDIEIAQNETTRLDVVMLARPTEPGVRIRGKRVAADALRFAAESTELGPEARMAIAELADLLLRLSDVGRIRLSVGGESALAPARVHAVRDALVAAGVGAERVEVGEAPAPADRVEITIAD